MGPFELWRVELLHSSSDADKSRSSKQWYVLDAKICGGYVSKFLSSSPLVLNFPSEFTSVQRSELKNGGILDDRHFQDSKVAIASLFGVVSAILRQKFKEREAAKYRLLVDAINSLKIGRTEMETSDIDIRPESSGTDLLPPPSSATEREKDRLKAHLDQAQRQLGSLSEEVKKLKQVIEISELWKLYWVTVVSSFSNRFECRTGLYCILNCSQGSQTKPGKRYLTSPS